ncbi:two-component system, LuxR family, sensor kinase FixL [Pseudomonas sp. IT-347P]|uniref:sensor histidine kinase n=1 Tax=Pseudomonas sp. IT-347P TaxID=3026458 RepID=UPI0039DF96B6
MSNTGCPRKVKRAGVNPLSYFLTFHRRTNASARPVNSPDKRRLETWLTWGIGLVVTAGIIVINTSPHHRDIAATVIYMTLLLMAAKVFTIRVVVGVSLICMATIVVMFFVDEGYRDWDSFTSFVRCLTALSAIGFLATRAKQAADNLHLNEIYLTGAQRLSHTGSVNFNGMTELMSWSGESARIFEYPVDMPVSKAMVLARTPAEDHAQVQDVFARAARREPQIEIRHRLLMPDGRIKHVHMIATPLFSRDDSFEYLGAVMDITERVQAEEMLYRTQAELTHICRVTTLGELTASIAHEVNQPLTAITSSADGCRRWLDRAHPDIHEAMRGLNQINDCALRAGEVISRVRALARKTEPVRRPEQINEIIKETLGVVQYEINHQHVNLCIDLDAGNPWILADRIQIQQVLINLLINACQAMSGVEQPRRLLSIRTSVIQNEVTLEVSDGGPGIDADAFPSLFTPFFTTRESGMGMGLSICRSIVDFHDGKIWARNLSNGASFFFSLPETQPPG